MYKDNLNKNREPVMENQNEKTPSMSNGEVKKKRYYKKRKPKAVVDNDVVKAEQGSSSSSPAASDTPTAKPRKSRSKRSYGNKDNDQLGYPKIQNSVNGQKVTSEEVRDSIENAMRISGEMVAAKYAEKDYAKEGAAWDNGAHSYTESCGNTDCGCEDECASNDGAQVDWDGLMDRLEAMNAAIGSQKATLLVTPNSLWDRTKAFVYGLLGYERALLLALVAVLEIRLGSTLWAIAFGALSCVNAVTMTRTVIRKAQYRKWICNQIAEGAEAYKK